MAEQETSTEPAAGAPALHHNVVTYVEAIEAFNRGDLDAVKNHVRADVVYRIPGDSLIAGEYHGINGFAEMLHLLKVVSGDTLTLAPTAVLADDDNLIARARVTARRGDRTLDTEHVYAFRFVGGKLADGQVFVSDPAQLETFWS
jgi:ketosteroid isomerase-like protein